MRLSEEAVREARERLTLHVMAVQHVPHKVAATLLWWRWLAERRGETPDREEKP